MNQTGIDQECLEWQPWRQSRLLAVLLTFWLLVMMLVIGGIVFPSGADLKLLVAFIPVIVIFVPICAVMLTCGMSTELGRDGLRISMAPFVRNIHIPLKNVTAVTVEQYRPLRDYYGWGLRGDRRGPAYTVSGNQGVRIHYGERESVLIGSQKPQELADAVTRFLERAND